MYIHFCPWCGTDNIEFREFYDLKYDCYFVCNECNAIFYVNNMEWKYKKREQGR